jgi:hypothetical protein
MSETTLISSQTRLTREELALVPTPNGIATHRPIPHVEVVNALVETLGFRHIGVVKEEYAVDKTGMKMFGVMELDQSQYGVRFALGLRNSHDRTMALGITVGYRVLVCENLAFHGDFTPFLRKHTRNFNLLENLAYGVDQMQRNFKPMIQAVERWQGSLISDVAAKLLIYAAFIEGEVELPKHLMRPVHSGYFSPAYEEFQPRTLWSLQNSFTGAIKTLEPVPLHRATASLAEFWQKVGGV